MTKLRNLSLTGLLCVVDDVLQLYKEYFGPEVLPIHWFILLFQLLNFFTYFINYTFQICNAAFLLFILLVFGCKFGIQCFYFVAHLLDGAFEAANFLFQYVLVLLMLYLLL